MSVVMTENAHASGRRNGARRQLNLAIEAPAEERAELRRAARIELRMYCVMCGRAESVERAPAHPGRCQSCDGTLITEIEAG
jgi:hypothetical protein